MLGIIGIAVIFVMVFGGYILAGGKMSIILHSLPYEMAMILGAACGAFLLSGFSVFMVGATGWHGGKLVFDYHLGTSETGS